MTLSRIASGLAREIQAQDWSDAHTRLDGSRHNRRADRTTAAQLEPGQAENVKLNVVWVVAQALSAEDPNFSVREFAEAAGVARDYLLTRRGTPNGMIEAGLRFNTDIAIRQIGNSWMAEYVSDVDEGRVQASIGDSPEAALEYLRST
jgi:hypothetical protein